MHQLAVHHKWNRLGKTLSRTLLAGALVISGGVGLFGGGSAQGLSSDASEASASLIEADLLGIDLAELIRAQSGTPSSPTANNANIDVALLNQLVDLDLLTLGIPLIGDGTNNGLLDLGSGAGLGLLNSYAYAPDAMTATAASGAVTSDGSINVGAVEDPTSQSAHIELTALLAQLGLDGLTDQVIDGLGLELGALASRAHVESGQPITSEYTVAGAKLVVSSPMVGELSTGINTALTQVDATVDSLLGSTGAVQTALNALNLDLSIPLVATVDLGTPTLNANLDIAPIVAQFTTGTYVGDGTGLVTLDLANGDIIVDLEMLHEGNLNSLPANTSLLTAAQITQITGALTDLLGDLVGDVTDAVSSAIDATALEITFDPTVSALLGVVTGDLSVTVSGTVAGFLGKDGAPAPTSNVTSTVEIAGVELDLSPVTTYVTSTVLPAVVTAVGGALTNSPLLTQGQETLTTALNTLIDPLVNSLSPLLDQVLNQIVDITINSQTTAANGAFTVRALLVEVLPGANVVALPLASSMVRVSDASSVTGLSPDSGPEVGGTKVTVTGSGFTGATAVEFDGAAGTEFAVVDDSTITVVTPAHAAGSVEVVVKDPAGDSDPLEFVYTSTASPDGTKAETITPGTGPTDGGTEVIIKGDGFTDATGVDFGGTPGTNFVVVDDNTIHVTTPAHEAGTVDVVVRHPSGDSNALQFTYRVQVRPGLPKSGADGAASVLPVVLLLVGSAAVFVAAGRRRRF